MILEQKELRYQGKVIFERLTLSASFTRVPKMFSEDEACFLYLTKGAFHYRTPSNIISFTEGDAMLAKCGNYFIEQAAINQASQHQTISATGAFFYPAMVKSFFETGLSLHHFTSTFDTTKIKVEPLLKSAVDSINYLLDNPSIADDNLIVTKLKELLLLLSKTEKAASIQQFVQSLFTPHEYDFAEVIRLNQYAHLSLAELAHLCNMSLATFKRKFTEVFNESPARYLTLKKLERAQQLLHMSSKPVSEIAYECGFESVPGFNKTFRKHIGHSPSEYRLSRADNSLSHLENSSIL